jgi:acyl carrier protein
MAVRGRRAAQQATGLHTAPRTAKPPAAGRANFTNGYDPVARCGFSAQFPVPKGHRTVTMPTSTFDNVVAVLQAQARNPLPELTPQSLLQSLGLDSLELMEFVFAVEDRFDLRIPEDRLDPRQLEITLGDVARAIDEVLSAGTAPPVGG